MASDILHNITRQPESLRQIREYLTGPGRPDLEAAADLLRQRERVMLTGMGGSLYALMPAATYLAKHGILVNLMDAGEALYYAEVPQDSAVAALSRSGRTAEVVRLTANLKARGVPVAALTNCPSEALGESADVTVKVAGDLDHGVSIQTYTGGVLTGLFLAACLTGTMVQFQHDLGIALRALESRMTEWHHAAAEWRWEERTHFYFLGRGYSLSSACEACLLMQELARRTATWYNAAEFRQGPVEALRRGHAVVLFTPDGETKHLNQALARDLAQTPAGVYQVGSALGVAEYLAPLLQVIPVQLAAYAIAARDHDAPGQFRFAAEVSEKEDGLAIA